MKITYNDIKNIQESNSEFFCNEQELGGRVVEIFGYHVMKSDR